MTLLLLLIYFLDNPIGAASGGSVLGYTYGGIATLGILYLLYYGMRKRSYFASKTTLLGVLSAHTWIGLSLLLIVPLHCAFSFGLNVHTLAYVLLCIVIFSGIWGAYLYIKLPQNLSSQRGGLKTKDLIGQLSTLESEIKKKSELLSPKTVAEISDLKELGKLPSILECCFATRKAANYKEKFSRIQNQGDEAEQETLLNFISLLAKRAELILQLKSEVRTHTLLRFWLFLHVPMSFAMFALVLIHIFSVFYNW